MSVSVTASDFRATLAAPASKLDTLKRGYANALAGLDDAELSYRAACRILGDVNREARQGGLFGSANRPAQAEAMRIINRARKALRRAERASLRALDALRLWPGAADAVRASRTH
jgi:hypothetical protein